MRRFFLPSQCLEQDPVPLEGEVLHHMARVLRLSPGTEVLLLDGTGQTARCQIETLERTGGSARVLSRWHEPPSGIAVHLLQAMAKGEKMDLVLQKGTELGVRAFSPVQTERSLAPLEGQRGQKRQARWEKIILEAARQCCRPDLPSLAAPRPLSEALGQDAELKLMFWEEADRPLGSILPQEPPGSVAVLIGPEGGFSAEEAAAGRQAGFIPVAIGPRILRTETAGIAVATILQYLYGDLNTAAPAPRTE